MKETQLRCLEHYCEATRKSLLYSYTYSKMHHCGAARKSSLHS